ncbi:hypothetical protein OG871_13885 [Kitasatospora sp. NBC_00374]|uniref:hypothetical protein n=1 Tax=Kitasatospora sp. NBC_00374 TaxID=2975964 RepID=UPI003249A26B
MSGADPTAGQERPPPPPGIGQIGRAFGTVVAPTSALTALLYYFGHQHAYWFFASFGVDLSPLGMSTVDYLRRSLDALFVPLVVLAAVALAAPAGHRLLTARLAARPGPRTVRLTVATLAALALPTALTGLWSVFATTFLTAHLVAAPAALAVGVTLLAYALHLHRSVPTGGVPAPPTAPATPDPQPTPTAPAAPDTVPPTPAAPATAPPGRATAQTPPPGPLPAARPLSVTEWAVVVTLVGVSLFWAANDYAAAVGRTRAAQFVAELPALPEAVVYSEHGLGITAPGVVETRCQAPDSAYAFRYDGLRLMIQSGGRYVLLPAHWRPEDGVAILLPSTDSIRLDFSAPGAAPGLPAC